MIRDFKKTIAGSRKGSLDDLIHVLWYCIDAGQTRIQDYDVEIVRALADEVPVILVLTQCIDDDRADALQQAIAIEKDCRGLQPRCRRDRCRPNPGARRGGAHAGATWDAGRNNSGVRGRDGRRQQPEPNSGFSRTRRRRRRRPTDGGRIAQGSARGDSHKRGCCWCPDRRPRRGVHLAVQRAAPPPGGSQADAGHRNAVLPARRLPESVQSADSAPPREAPPNRVAATRRGRCQAALRVR